jgi:dipeptidyl aminopeptidase/acylaminoacyl peptidase
MTKYPGDDVKDLMAPVDKVIAKGYIAPKRMAVTGGGLLTAWIVKVHETASAGTNTSDH